MLTLSAYLRFFSSMCSLWMLESSKSLHVSVFLGGQNPLGRMSSLASAALFAPLLSCSLKISWSKASISTSIQTELKISKFRSLSWRCITKFLNVCESLRVQWSNLRIHHTHYLIKIIIIIGNKIVWLPSLTSPYGGSRQPVPFLQYF